MSSSDTSGEFTPENQSTLLSIASASIDYGLSERSALPVIPLDYPELLRQPRASFVTLRIGGRLRGCMGSLEATEPLVVNVAKNAYSAAFRDPRFAPLVREEFPQIGIHLSLLSRPEPLEFETEEQLLAQIRPGVHGVTLIEGNRRATLLPAVWESVREPGEFLTHLKRKAGLPVDYWSKTILRRTLYRRVDRRGRIGLRPFLDQDVHALLVRQNDVGQTVAIHVGDVELRADPRVASFDDLVANELRRAPLAAFDLVPDHDHGLMAARIVAVVREVALAGDDVALTVAVDVDVVHRMRLRERLIDHMLLERLACSCLLLVEFGVAGEPPSGKSKNENLEDLAGLGEGDRSPPP